MGKTWITWKKLNSIVPGHVSTYPSGVWLIRKGAPCVGFKWTLLRAANDGDVYRTVSYHKNLVEAKQAANDWLPNA